MAKVKIEIETEDMREVVTEVLKEDYSDILAEIKDAQSRDSLSNEKVTEFFNHMKLAAAYEDLLNRYMKPSDAVKFIETQRKKYGKVT